jgi:hypothetical protein
MTLSLKLAQSAVSAIDSGQGAEPLTGQLGIEVELDAMPGPQEAGGHGAEHVVKGIGEVSQVRKARTHGRLGKTLTLGNGQGRGMEAVPLSVFAGRNSKILSKQLNDPGDRQIDDRSEVFRGDIVRAFAAKKAHCPDDPGVSVAGIKPG